MAEGLIVVGMFQGLTLPYPHTCAKCKKQYPQKLRMCGRCRQHFYCSAACQKEDWAMHKMVICIKISESNRLAELRQAVATVPFLVDAKCVDVHNDELLKCSLDMCHWNVEAASFLLGVVATRSYTQLHEMSGSVGGKGKKNVIKQFLGGLEVLFGWKVSGKRLHQLESLLGIKEEVSNYLTTQEAREERRLSWLARALPVVDKIYKGLRPMMFIVHLCYTVEGEIIGDRTRKKILLEMLDALHRSCREKVEG